MGRWSGIVRSQLTLFQGGYSKADWSDPEENKTDRPKIDFYNVRFFPLSLQEVNRL